jgi:hypothetical protein
LKFVRIFRLSFVIVPIFFSENLSKTLTNKTKKELGIAIVRLMTHELGSWVHTKKHFQFSTNYFNLVFPDFSPNLPDFFSTVFSKPGHIEQKKINQICRSCGQLWSRMHTKIIIFADCPNFSTFLCNFPDFFSWKLFHDYNEQNKKKELCIIHHKKALSVFPQFSNFPGNFSSFSLHKNLIRIITNI